MNYVNAKLDRDKRVIRAMRLKNAGLTNKQIAEELGISLKTVRGYVSLHDRRCKLKELIAIDGLDDSKIDAIAEEYGVSRKTVESDIEFIKYFEVALCKQIDVEECIKNKVGGSGEIANLLGLSRYAITQIKKNMRDNVLLSETQYELLRYVVGGTSLDSFCDTYNITPNKAEAYKEMVTGETSYVSLDLSKEELSDTDECSKCDDSVNTGAVNENNCADGAEESESNESSEEVVKSASESTENNDSAEQGNKESVVDKENDTSKAVDTVSEVKKLDVCTMEHGKDSEVAILCTKSSTKKRDGFVKNMLNKVLQLFR